MAKINHEIATLSNNPAHQMVATANLFGVSFFYQGVQGEVYFANRRIEANEQLLRDYQLGFWAKLSRRDQLKFFDKTTGYVLPHISLNPPQPTMTIMRDSPVLSPLSRLRKKIDCYQSKQTEVFFKAFDNQQYNKALRIACTSDSENARHIVSVLLADAVLLRLDPNEKPNTTSSNAFEISEQRGGGIYDLLCRHFTDHRKSAESLNAATQFR